MQSIVLVVIIGLIGGIAVALQASLAGVFSERVGLIGNGVFVFGGGFLFALIVMMFAGTDPLKAWRTVPWYVYLAGPLGIVIISSIGYSIPRIGVASTLTLIVAAQLIVGVAMDHFGLLTIPRPMDIQRLVGITILFLGTWIVLR